MDFNVETYLNNLFSELIFSPIGSYVPQFIYYWISEEDAAPSGNYNQRAQISPTVKNTHFKSPCQNNCEGSVLSV